LKLRREEGRKPSKDRERKGTPRNTWKGEEKGINREQEHTNRRSEARARPKEPLRGSLLRRITKRSLRRISDPRIIDSLIIL